MRTMGWGLMGQRTEGLGDVDCVNRDESNWIKVRKSLREPLPSPLPKGRGIRREHFAMIDASNGMAHLSKAGGGEHITQDD